MIVTMCGGGCRNQRLSENEGCEKHLEKKKNLCDLWLSAYLPVVLWLPGQAEMIGERRRVRRKE